MRTLRKIDALQAIPNAQQIETAVVDGWKVVVRCGDFKVGDECLYFEIDSFLPDGVAGWQDIVNKSHNIFNGRRGHKLRTKRLKGQISQGLALPMGAIVTAAGERAGDIVSSVSSGDYAAYINVVKFEPVCSSVGIILGPMPSFIRKTDKERCQNMVAKIFAQPPDTRYEVSLKLDGASCTFYVHDGGAKTPNIGVCSRNFELNLAAEGNSENPLVSTFLRLGMYDTLLNYHDKTRRNIAVQGELMGPNISNNRESLPITVLHVFDIFDIDARAHLSPKERHNVLAQLGNSCLEHVPIIYPSTTLGEMNVTDIDSLLAAAEGPSMVHSVREGLVFKSIDGVLAFKVINNTFLLSSKKSN